MLGMIHPERNYEFINRAISGNQTSDLLKRWETDAIDVNPDVLSVLIGVKIILLEPFADIPRQKNVPTSENIRAAILLKEQKIVRRLADEFNAIFVPLQAVFDEAMTIRAPGYWIWDGTHPTEAGHGLIAREFLHKASPIFGFNL